MNYMYSELTVLCFGLIMIYSDFMQAVFRRLLELQRSKHNVHNLLGVVEVFLFQNLKA